MPDQEHPHNAADPPADNAAHGAGEISPLIIIPPVVIAALLALLLGVVYNFTAEPIKQAKLADKRAKLIEVMPPFANDPLATAETPAAAEIVVYAGLDENEQPTGYGITSAVSTGYSGHFAVVFGVQPDGTVEKVRILESMETPGLGSKAGAPEWLSQFEGRALADFNFAVTKDGGEVDAITGATITSRAVCDAVRQGLERFEQESDGGDS